MARCDVIHKAGSDRALRHGCKFAGCRLLGHDHSGTLFQGPDAERSIAAHARENDAHGLSILVLGEVPEECINGRLRPKGRGWFEQYEGALEYGEIGSGRLNVYGIRSGLHAVILDLHHRHLGVPLQDLREEAGLVRVLVLDDNKGHAASHRHVLEEFL